MFNIFGLWKKVDGADGVFQNLRVNVSLSKKMLLELSSELKFYI